MLLCADRSFYIGITHNADTRVARHQIGHDPTCYTYKRRPVKLVRCSEFREVTDAIAWEKHLKGWSRAKKVAFISGNWPTTARPREVYELDWLPAVSLGRPSTSLGATHAPVLRLRRSAPLLTMAQRTRAAAERYSARRPSSARFNSSTLTRGSPRKPKVRPWTCLAIIALMEDTLMPRALATRGASQ